MDGEGEILIDAGDTRWRKRKSLINKVKIGEDNNDKEEEGEWVSEVGRGRSKTVGHVGRDDESEDSEDAAKELCSHLLRGEYLDMFSQKEKLKRDMKKRKITPSQFRKEVTQVGQHFNSRYGEKLMEFSNALFLLFCVGLTLNVLKDEMETIHKPLMVRSKSTGKEDNREGSNSGLILME